MGFYSLVVLSAMVAFAAAQVDMNMLMMMSMMGGAGGGNEAAGAGASGATGAGASGMAQARMMGGGAGAVSGLSGLLSNPIMRMQALSGGMGDRIRDLTRCSFMRANPMAYRMCTMHAMTQ